LCARGSDPSWGGAGGSLTGAFVLSRTRRPVGRYLQREGLGRRGSYAHPMPAPQPLGPLSLTLGVRPARCLILVPDIEGIPWMRVFEAAIASQMRCWGGGQSLVLPYSDTLGDNPLFWELLDRADPDHVLVYTGSMAELEELDPDRFEDARQRQEAELAEVPGDLSMYWKEWRELQLVGYEIPATLRDDVTRRAAPLRLPGWEEWMWTNGATEPLEPLTDVTEFQNLPRQVTDVGRANLRDLEHLLLTVELGRLSPGMRDALLGREVAIETEELAGTAPARGLIFRRPQSERVYPLAISELGLAWYRTGRFTRTRIPIVVGDDAWDFAFFYALRRWRSLAYWVPESSLNDNEYCRNLIVALEMQLGAGGGAIVVSASAPSRTGQWRQRLQDWQQRMAGSRPPRVELTDGGWRDVLPVPVNRLYEREGFDRPHSLYLHEGRTPALPTPTPELVAVSDVHKLRWFTDVVVDGWGALRDGDLPSALLVGPGLDEERLRVGRDGPSYLSPRALTFTGMSSKGAALRPQLVPLPLAEQLRCIAARGGWQIIQSDKGVYASESAQLFGGEVELAAALRDAPLRRVVDGFLADDEASLGRCLGDRRRYLAYDDFRTLVGGDEADRVLGQLEEAEAITRGLVLKCWRCRAGGFYTPAESDPSFRCHSCRLEQRATRASWLNEIEPVWYYRLDEVLRRFVQHRGHLPLFAAIDLTVDPDDPGSVEFAFELEFRHEDAAALELDIVARTGSELWIGEATTRDHFASGGASEQARFGLIHRLAVDLNARHVVLATSKTFRETTRRVASQRLVSDWYVLHLAESVALYPVASESEQTSAAENRPSA
jgi:hypothetical protein